MPQLEPVELRQQRGVLQAQTLCCSLQCGLLLRQTIGTRRQLGILCKTGQELIEIKRGGSDY